jgi:PadR family transcriptional regulator, regulatory protein AphA
MSLPYALLGLIDYQPATGYDLKTTFGKSIHFFWNATLPQIYRTLNQMESNGWVTSTMEHQEGKPSRKVYSITGPGRAEFLSWLALPPQSPEPRSPLLVKVFFGNKMPRERFIGQIRQYRAHLVELLGRYSGEAAPVIEGRTGSAGTDEDAYFWSLTLDFGRRRARMGIEWCDEILKGAGGGDKG